MAQAYTVEEFVKALVALVVGALSDKVGTAEKEAKAKAEPEPKKAKAEEKPEPKKGKAEPKAEEKGKKKTDEDDLDALLAGLDNAPAGEEPEEPEDDPEATED